MSRYIVDLQGVRHEYAAHGSGKRVTALNDVHLEIPYGSTVAILGESGSGKTTLLNIIGGLERASSGQVFVDGSDLQAMTDAALTRFRAKRVGFVFQDFNLIADLTAQENVALPMDAFPTFPPSERKSRAFELLQAVNLEDRSTHDPQHLSGGERQRVAIARALANRPVLILADEPTGNLDKRHRGAILDLLLRVSRGSETTTIIVTHDVRVAERCDLEYHLRDGRIRATHRTTKRLALLKSEAERGMRATSASAAPLCAVA